MFSLFGDCVFFVCLYLGFVCWVVVCIFICLFVYFFVIFLRSFYFMAKFNLAFSILCTPPPPPFCRGGGGGSNQIFRKDRRLTGSQFLEGGSCESSWEVAVFT